MPNARTLATLAVIAGIGAFLLRTIYLTVSPKPSQSPPLERVATAAADLPAGLLLHSSDVIWRSVPRAQAASDALTDRGPGATNVKGALLRHAVSAGTVLRTTDVTQADAPDFLAAALQPGMRAISVAIDDVSGNAGLIQPGDYVDVLLTRQFAGAVRPERAVVSQTVVRRVRVLAVGTEFQRPKSASAAGSNAGARTVTLEVTPNTAQVISVAMRLGTLSLLLRSFATSDRRQSDAGTDTEPAVPPTWAGDVSNTLAASPREPTSPGADPIAPQQSVVIYRGSSSGGDESNGTGTTGMPPLPPGMPGMPALGSMNEIAPALLSAIRH